MYLSLVVYKVLMAFFVIIRDFGAKSYRGE
jgi:hypothetical protein